MTISGNGGLTLDPSAGTAIVNGVSYKIPVIIASSAQAATRNSANAAGDATFAAVATITIPAGTLKINDRLVINTNWSVTNSGNVKNVITRFGGTTYRTVVMTNLASLKDQAVVLVRDTTSQLGGSSSGSASGGFATSTGTPPTTSLDIGTAIDITIGGTWAGATSSEAITLEAYTVELVRA